MTAPLIASGHGKLIKDGCQLITNDTLVADPVMKGRQPCSTVSTSEHMPITPLSS